jgi:adenylyltransferase/sulfurtransferase
VLGILPGVIGVIQATEAVKLILGKGETLSGRLLLYDALNMRFRELKLRRNPDCPICGDHRTIHQLIDYHQFCGVPRQPAPEPAAADGEIDVTALKSRMDQGDRFVLVDVRERHEFDICRIPGSTLIPLSELGRRLGELDRTADIVVHCKSGVRSAKACALLREAGFTRVTNVRGGILAWSDKVDPSVPKY